MKDDFYFSQYALNEFRHCPLKFKYRYIDGLYWDNDKDDEFKMSIEKGKNFHLMAQRYFLGVPDSNAYMEEYAELNEWIDDLKQFVPIDDRVRYFPEYELRVRDEKRIRAKYDLVVIDEMDNITIYDWKTEHHELSSKWARAQLQTKVYLYVMAKAGGLLTGSEVVPEQITMVYWQPVYAKYPIRLQYSKEQFEDDYICLKRLIDEIEQFDYELYDMTGRGKKCERCEYCYFCNQKRE